MLLVLVRELSELLIITEKKDCDDEYSLCFDIYPGASAPLLFCVHTVLVPEALLLLDSGDLLIL